jgi:hypothetical protein
MCACRLEELKRSGRAQRVILPDLGPDAPVLLVPGQGEEVLLLFHALRQARLDVGRTLTNGAVTEEDLSTLGAGGDRLSPETGSPTPHPSSSSARQTYHPSSSSQAQGAAQSSDSDTDVKRAGKSGGKSQGGVGASDRQRSPPSTEDEEKDLVGRLPRPTPHHHHHRLGRPQDMRVRELRGGLVVPEPRRTRSLVERPTISALASASIPGRSHRSASPSARPLSPREGADWSREARITRSPAGRISVRAAGVEPRTVSSHTPSPSRFTFSASSSPYRHHLSPSPLRTSVSPAAATTSAHKLPPLEFPEDLVSPRGAGGQGRVPRREAWERQRQGKPLRHSPLSFSPSPAAQSADSGAQARFMAVLCREIEELKHKIEVLEECGGDRPLSPPRHSPATFTPTATGEHTFLLSSYFYLFI